MSDFKNIIILILFTILCMFWESSMAWLSEPIGTSKIPMYVYFYPIIAAIFAGSIAIYAAHKAYAAAMVTDVREKFFKEDEIERKRLAYVLSLSQSLKRLKANVSPEMVNGIEEGLKNDIAIKNFKEIGEVIDRNFFLEENYDALYADWNVISCLQQEILKDLFKIIDLLENKKLAIEVLKFSALNLSDVQNLSAEASIKELDKFHERWGQLKIVMDKTRQAVGDLGKKLNNIYGIESI